MWIPVDVALQHYEACDTRGLSASTAYELGRRTLTRMRGTYVGTAIKLATEVGATPWTIVPHIGRFWGIADEPVLSRAVGVTRRRSGSLGRQTQPVPSQPATICRSPDTKSHHPRSVARISAFSRVACALLGARSLRRRRRWHPTTPTQPNERARELAAPDVTPRPAFAERARPRRAPRDRDTQTRPTQNETKPMSKHLRALYLAPILAVACTAPTGPSPTDSEPIGSSQAAITGGGPVATGDEINELVAKVAFGNITVDYQICSGVFLTEHWVLTAAHCVGHPMSTLFVHNSSAKVAGGVATVDQVIVHPQYTVNPNGSTTLDVALLHESSVDVNEPMLQVHAPFFEMPMLHTPVQVGSILDFFGYGFTSPNDQTNYVDLTLHEGVLQVVGTIGYGYQAGDDGTFSAMPALGDSGGPAFVIDFVHSNGFARLLAGTDAYLSTDNQQPFPYVGQVAISSVATWIESYISAGQITDAGYSTWLRASADVNGDHVQDYCRIVGNPGGLFLACQLGMFNESTNGVPTRWQTDPYLVRTPVGTVIDPGYSGTGYMQDVNGDGRADFCRTVGDPGSTFVACDYATPSGFSSATLTPL